MGSPLSTTVHPPLGAYPDLLAAAERFKICHVLANVTDKSATLHAAHAALQAPETAQLIAGPKQTALLYVLNNVKGINLEALDFVLAAGADPSLVEQEVDCIFARIRDLASVSMDEEQIEGTLASARPRLAAAARCHALKRGSGKPQISQVSPGEAFACSGDDAEDDYNLLAKSRLGKDPYDPFGLTVALSRRFEALADADSLGPTEFALAPNLMTSGSPVLAFEWSVSEWQGTGQHVSRLCNSNGIQQVRFGEIGSSEGYLNYRAVAIAENRGLQIEYADAANSLHQQFGIALSIEAEVDTERDPSGDMSVAIYFGPADSLSPVVEQVISGFDAVELRTLLCNASDATQALNWFIEQAQTGARWPLQNLTDEDVRSAASLVDSASTLAVSLSAITQPASHKPTPTAAKQAAKTTRSGSRP